MVGCCLINADDLTMLEAREECELLRSHNCFDMLFVICT